MNETTPPPVPSALQPKTSTLAIWSLVLGISSLVGSLLCLGLLAAIPGVICAHKAISGIKKSNGLLSGEGMAIGGMITGYISIAMSVLLIPMMCAIAIPNFVKARNTALTNLCINNLRQIDSAKQQWALENNKQPGDVPTVTDLTPYFKNHQMPVCVAGGVYTIGAVSNAPTCSIQGHVLPPADH